MYDKIHLPKKTMCRFMDYRSSSKNVDGNTFTVTMYKLQVDGVWGKEERK